MSPVELKQKLHELCEQGFVHLPNFVPEDVLEDIQKTVHEAFYDTPYGRDERTGAAEDKTRLVGLGTNVDVMPVLQLPGKSPLMPLTNLGLQDLLVELLGKDFYLDRATIRRARAKSERFYFHKDQHGDIGLTVLLNDLEDNAGATSALPRRHLGTPPTVYSIKNINVTQPGEVQMTGKAGDAYLFYRDIDHSRAENLTANDNIQMIFAFVNKNTQPASNNRQCLDQETLRDLPASLQHMLRSFDGAPDDAAKGFLEKFLYGSGFASPGAGDYDVRNDLFRDFLYTIFLVRGKSLRNASDQSLPRNTTRLNETRKITVWKYLRELSWWLVFRSYVLAILRKSALGEAVIHSLKRALNRA